MKLFNTTGANKPDIHYSIPPLERIDLEALLQLIAAQKYFVLHAPRQTGKTSCLLALRDLLNQEGQYACVYCNVEVGQSAREDVEVALRTITNQIASRAKITLGENFLFEQLPALRAEDSDQGLLNRLLTVWSEHSAKPLVLFIDEIDSLLKENKIAVLSTGTPDLLGNRIGQQTDVSIFILGRYPALKIENGIIENLSVHFPNARISLI